MKVRMKDNSIRFRVTLKEVEQLQREGRLARETRIGAGGELAGVFRYAVQVDRERPESDVTFAYGCITLHLSQRDADVLFDPAEEGTYIKREWVEDNGVPSRFMAFVEKDRPGSTCVKKEAWIYEESLSGEDATCPIPTRN